MYEVEVFSNLALIGLGESQVPAKDQPMPFGLISPQSKSTRDAPNK